MTMVWSCAGKLWLWFGRAFFSKLRSRFGRAVIKAARPCVSRARCGTERHRRRAEDAHAVLHVQPRLPPSDVTATPPPRPAAAPGPSPRWDRSAPSRRPAAPSPAPPPPSSAQRAAHRARAPRCRRSSAGDAAPFTVRRPDLRTRISDSLTTVTVAPSAVECERAARAGRAADLVN
jgi:hypothetical protein